MITWCQVIYSNSNYKSGRPEVRYNKGVFKNFTKFVKKNARVRVSFLKELHACGVSFLIKLQASDTGEERLFLYNTSGGCSCN